MRLIFILTCLLCFESVLISQEDKVLPPPIIDSLGTDTLEQAPEYDAEMRIFDEFGFFYTVNAFKISPQIALGDIKGVNLFYEKGNFGKKFSMNFGLSYFGGVLQYASKIGVVNGENTIITDSSTILIAAPRHLKFELHPRFYFFENFGVFIGPSVGARTKDIFNKTIPIAGISSGLAFKWKGLLMDNSIGIFYDEIGYGVEDFDVSMRININIGFYWYRKGAEVAEFE